MAFIIFFFFLKKFGKIEKTGIISTKLSLRCTPSVILGLNGQMRVCTKINCAIQAGLPVLVQSITYYSLSAKSICCNLLPEPKIALFEAPGYFYIIFFFNYSSTSPLQSRS